MLVQAAASGSAPASARSDSAKSTGVPPTFTAIEACTRLPGPTASRQRRRTGTASAPLGGAACAAGRLTSGVSMPSGWSAKRWASTGTGSAAPRSAAPQGQRKAMMVGMFQRPPTAAVRAWTECGTASNGPPGSRNGRGSRSEAVPVPGRTKFTLAVADSRWKYSATTMSRCATSRSTPSIARTVPLARRQRIELATSARTTTEPCAERIG